MAFGWKLDNQKKVQISSFFGDFIDFLKKLSLIFCAKMNLRKVLFNIYQLIFVPKYSQVTLWAEKFFVMAFLKFQARRQQSTHQQYILLIMHSPSWTVLGAPTQISWLPKTWLQNSFQMRSIAYKVFRREKEGVRADSTVTKKAGRSNGSTIYF